MSIARLAHNAAKRCKDGKHFDWFVGQEALAEIAAYNGYLDVCLFLADEGLDMSHPLVLSLAAEHGQLHVFKRFVTDDVRWRGRDYKRFHMALINGHLSMVAWLMEHYAMFTHKWEKHLWQSWQPKAARHMLATWASSPRRDDIPRAAIAEVYALLNSNKDGCAAPPKRCGRS